jgi:hypothetical protein
MSVREGIISPTHKEGKLAGQVCQGMTLLSTTNKTFPNIIYKRLSPPVEPLLGN